MFKYSLIKGSKKSLCPNCGKKRFVNYVDIETGELLPSHVGRCDREVNCGYHLTPKQYFSDNNIIEPTLLRVFVDEVKPQSTYHPLEYISKSVVGHDNLTVFLHSVFSEKQVNSIVDQYKIGTSKYWKNSTVFWQVDNIGRVRAGKVILYDKTGHRSKYATWIHSILLKKSIISEFHLDQCLFGLHLIREHQPRVPIAIVESEKTACIMSEVYPSYVWMATGGSNNIGDKYFEPLKSHKIILFPDLSKDDVVFDKWSQKVEHLKKYGFDISISTLLQNIATIQDKVDGLDIADYFLEKRDIIIENVGRDPPVIYSECLSGIHEIQTINEKRLQGFISKNPLIIDFIERLELTLE